ncbi:putative MFS monocarboxylate transporter [Eremomyces bilateralis CBS 781.70]|uniref:MFS monocarboxylate transporter n=1 Tax=Eremomyces bilateralis CBS 781.70 TaxID=1392243 RepID=A0A6G1GG42_9PEZI|nr:putative MFS monocarboxylate transporter [Eremomyces bilateralis CBS 781.70]KAF1817075.1 putative MFS monocarboxylate transporter [Eremomyces bilateralis CBS 781.70]
MTAQDTFDESDYGGKDAWLFLAAAFMVESLVWGFPFSYGVFQQYYSTHEPFAGSSNIALIGTVSSGIMYLDSLIVFGAMKAFPKLRRPFAVIGLVILCLALGLSSFSQTVTHLIATQGLLYGIGGSIAYSPTILFLNEWFIRRKGLAFGIMWAGTGLAGVVLPFLMQWLLDSYGFRTTLRIWALAVCILTAPLLYYLKPRLPVSPAMHARRLDFRFATTRVFGMLQIGSVVESLGFFLPSIYLPMHATALGASGFKSSLTLTLLNLMSVVGCVFMGIAVDRFHITTCIMLSTVGTCVAVFLFWGLASNLTLLYLFSMIYGLFAGSYSTTWSGIVRDVQKVNNAADTGLIFALLAVGKGLGNVVSGPLSEVLLKAGTGWGGRSKFAYDNGYGGLIAFTGVTAFFGGFSYLGHRVGWI